MITDTAVLIGVINFGVGPNVPWPKFQGRPDKLMEPTWLYGGKPYTYEVSVPGHKEPIYTIVPLEVAYFHWAIEINPIDGKLRRATEPKDDEDDSWFANRLSGMAPKVYVKRYPDEPFNATHNPSTPTDDPAFVDWYTNGVAFKMKKLSTKMTAAEFMS